MPSISVIIPTYRRFELLEAAVESVLGQSCQADEIIIVDDGSGEEYTARYDFPAPVRVICRPQQGGPAAARNAGVAEASGEFLAFLDSDDRWLPDKLERQLGILEAHSNAALTYCQVYVVDEHDAAYHWQPVYTGLGVEVEEDAFLRLLRRNEIVSPSTVLIRRDVFLDYGGFDETLLYGEDWDFWLRVTRRYPIIADPEIGCRYRKHPEQITSRMTEKHLWHVRIREKWPELLHSPYPAERRLARRCYGRDLLALAKAQAGAGDYFAALATLHRAYPYQWHDHRLYTRYLRYRIAQLRQSRNSGNIA